MLNDYEEPGRMIDSTPRPRASTIVAARKRAVEETQVERVSAPAIRLTPTHIKIALGAGAALFLAVLTLGLPHSPVKLEPTPAPAFTGQPTSAPTTLPTQTPAPRTIGAYAAPDGLLLGEIAEDKAIQPVAHYGTGWVAYQDGAGLVWVRTQDRPDLALAGKDLAIQPVSLQPQPQTGRGLTTEEQPSPVPEDFYTTPPKVDPAFQQSLIGTDPNALACGGNPMCGGLTNAEAQAILDGRKKP